MAAKRPGNTDRSSATEERSGEDTAHPKTGRLIGSQTYSLRETAELFGTGYTSFWEAMRQGNLPVTPLRIGGQWRFPRAAVHRVLEIEET